MKKKILTILVCGCLLFGLTGCKEEIDFFNMEVPKTAIKESAFTNPKNENDQYVQIEYNKREYILFGKTNEDMKNKYVKKCIGYNENDEKRRYYSLVDSDDLILEYIVDGDLELFTIFRALDTKDKKIDVPKYITDAKYEYWI